MSNKNTSKPAIVRAMTGRILFAVFGWIDIVFFGLGFIGYLTMPNISVSGCAVIIAFLAIGVLMVLKSHMIKKRIVKFRKYADIIINQGNDSIIAISGILDMPENAVVSDLNSLIDRHYFKNASIDTDMHKIVFGKKDEMSVDHEDRQAESAGGSGIREVKCKCCGAVNKIESGKAQECEYCGAPLNS